MSGIVILFQLCILEQCLAIRTGHDEKLISSSVTGSLSTNDCYLAEIDALKMAAEEGNDTMIEELITRDLDIDSRNNLSDVTPLYLAASNGHGATVRLLLDHGANIEAEVETEVGPLHLLSYAVRDNNTLAVTNLLHYGADVNRTSSILNIAPIHRAVDLDNKIVAEILIKHGANVNSETENKYWYVFQPQIDHNFEHLPRRPLGIAVIRCAEDMVELLVTHGSFINVNEGGMTPLEIAIFKRCEKVALKLLILGASVNTIEGRWTPLHWAVDRQMQEVVKFLMSGDLLKTRDSDGKTPLHLSVKRGGQITKILLDYGADVNKKDKFGKTPLHEVGSPETAKLLLQSGANVNEKDELGKTALHLAIFANISKLFLERGAQINAQDKYGETPLHTHAADCNLDIVKVLLLYNASMDITCQERNIFIKDEFKVYQNFLQIVLHKQTRNNSTPITGLTPMALAAGDSNEEILTLLIEKKKSKLNLENAEWPPLHVPVCTRLLERCNHNDNFGNEVKKHIFNLKFLVSSGSDVNIRDAYNLTALHKAIMAGRIGAVKTLIDLNADINAFDINGWTPLHAAVKHQDITIAEILMEAGSDINIADRSGFTSLMWAVIGYRPYFFQLMVEKNLELTSTNRYHYFSKMIGFPRDIMDFLMSVIHKIGQPESILDVKYISFNLFRIMSLIKIKHSVHYHTYGKIIREEIKNISIKHINMMTMIAKNTVDFDIQDQIMGWTALHWASASGDYDAVVLLVEKGACLNLKSWLGHTPMFLARYWGQEGIYDYLKLLGAVW